MGPTQTVLLPAPLQYGQGSSGVAALYQPCGDLLRLSDVVLHKVLYETYIVSRKVDP